MFVFTHVFSQQLPFKTPKPQRIGKLSDTLVSHVMKRGYLKHKDLSIEQYDIDQV
jgi:hypothetical protein